MPWCERRWASFIEEMRVGGRPSLRSLRDLFCLVLCVTSVSVLVTYHLSRHLPARSHTELQIQLHGRLHFYPNPDSLETDSAQGPRRGLEGIDIEEKIQRKPRSWQSQMKDINSPRQLPGHVITRIKQIEASLLGTDSTRQMAVLDGGAEAVVRDLPVYKYALKRMGYSVTVTQAIEGLNESVIQKGALMEGPDPQHQLFDTGWSFYFCLSQSNSSRYKECSALHYYSQEYSGHVKVNKIPGVDKILSRENFCAFISSTSHIPASSDMPYALPCFVLPEQWHDFLRQSHSLGDSTRWVVKPLENSGGKIHLMQPGMERDTHKLQLLQSQRAVVQKYMERPLLQYGMPTSVTVYVLMTSLSPLRAYVHSWGTVQYRHDYTRNFQKVPGRTLSLDQWQTQLIQSHGTAVAEQAFRNMDRTLTQALLTAEAQAATLRPHRCSHCVQLVAFDLIFNESFHPIIVQVSPNPDIQDTVQSNSWSSGQHHSTLIDDMVAMVTDNTPVTGDVAKALGEMNVELNLYPGACVREDSVCLRREDMENLLHLRREMLHRGRFRQLYPCPDCEKYLHLVENKSPQSYDQQTVESNIGTNQKQSSHSSTNQKKGKSKQDKTQHNIHPLLISISRYFHTMDSMDHSYDDLNLPVRGGDALGNSVSQTHNSTHIDTQALHTCSEDRVQMPYLQGFHTDPPLELSPRFNASVTEYYAIVAYDVILVKVWAFAACCYSEARLEEKYGLSRPSNYTLGIGSNEIHIVVVDITHTEPWAINTYTLHIHRRPHRPLQQPALARGSHKQAICSLVQDCSLRYQQGASCGLRPSSRYESWGAYIHSHTLPHCTTGDAPGEWLVQCVRCDDADSCDYDSATWQPYNCIHTQLSRDQLKTCLAGKQILFIGDSTNRGMMHYLMEQVNDSLTEWDKTHNTKVYSNINQDRTAVSFAYYPQFWLPANQRPVFDKALYQLLKQSVPLENNHNTVLVVGGVHWLATHHLHVIRHALQREGLPNIRVVMKSLGAGFHQPVDGLHCLSLKEQRKLLIHNVGLVDFAQQQGFDVVDTFNMTMARYRDFLQGKCACHFHRVKEVLPSFTQYMKNNGAKGGQGLVDMPIQYHVEGPINAAYSEILLNRICDDR